MARRKAKKKKHAKRKNAAQAMGPGGMGAAMAQGGPAIMGQ